MQIKIKSNRIESIDILRGVVMVLMALDHTRGYFHYDSFLSHPTDIDSTTPLLFFTRFITHYCAPVFVFLAGTSAFLYGSKKSKFELFKFLLIRGIWLIFLEIVVNNFIWFFDFSYSIINLQVIWAIGFSMICLSFLIFLPKKVLLALGTLLIVGHNALDFIVMEGQSFQNIIWYFMKQKEILTIPGHIILVNYPLIPWIGLMALGYLFGTFYQKEYEVSLRRKWLLRIGIGLLALFFILRYMNFYGDLYPWSSQNTTTKTILSFFNVTKYPPSLLFVCITMGPAMLFLYLFENTKNKITNFFLVFGRVPLFYYFIHIFVLHLLAILVLLIIGGDWHDMILTGDDEGLRDSYGYALWKVCLVWIGVVLLLYPLSKKYMIYKANNKDKWWLSYL
ncbi:hypothetical protein BTO04_03515 [Polaribacter sp. SA4-10]|uniref:DUF1624 domain-containing protein n=1 Tax=Polaribacter sp. SA4-10 TaxID=754397 RepID=UPI000B3D24BC|nr:heparan-alpha-glucosaminide N-acetyltransferase domain-containing protein [Polaribacter sp. SA4-10]ARV05822.1 hypothetical protein BTO04_03515 [Polaribacter sp. SA4-10]